MAEATPTSTSETLASHTLEPQRIPILRNENGLTTDERDGNEVMDTKVEQRIQWHVHTDVGSAKDYFRDNIACNEAWVKLYVGITENPEKRFFRQAGAEHYSLHLQFGIMIVIASLASRDAETLAIMLKANLDGDRRAANAQSWSKHRRQRFKGHVFVYICCSDFETDLRLMTNYQRHNACKLALGNRHSAIPWFNMRKTTQAHPFALS